MFQRSRYVARFYRQFNVDLNHRQPKVFNPKTSDLIRRIYSSGANSTGACVVGPAGGFAVSQKFLAYDFFSMVKKIMYGDKLNPKKTIKEAESLQDLELHFKRYDPDNMILRGKFKGYLPGASIAMDGSFDQFDSFFFEPNTLFGVRLTSKDSTYPVRQRNEAQIAFCNPQMWVDHTDHSKGEQDDRGDYWAIMSAPEIKEYCLSNLKFTSRTQILDDWQMKSGVYTPNIKVWIVPQDELLLSQIPRSHGDKGHADKDNKEVNTIDPLYEPLAICYGVDPTSHRTLEGGAIQVKAHISPKLSVKEVDSIDSALALARNNSVIYFEIEPSESQGIIKSIFSTLASWIT